MMEINFGSFRIPSSSYLNICFSPDILSYMKIYDNNAAVPKKYSKDNRRGYFYETYSELINKTKKDDVPDNINFKSYTKVDIDDYAYMSSKEMWVHGNYWNMGSFNFPNDVHKPSINFSNAFNGILSYSDTAYNFSGMFINCFNFSNIFGYPFIEHTGNGRIRYRYHYFRNHYEPSQELADYNINYKYEYGIDEFPGYNCRQMFIGCNNLKASDVPFDTDLSVDRLSCVTHRLNYLNFFKMHKVDDYWDDVPAIDDASWMFSGLINVFRNYTEDGVLKNWDIDIRTNNSQYMFYNTKVQANHTNLRCENYNGYVNMFRMANFTGASPNVNIWQGVTSLDWMFSDSIGLNMSAELDILSAATRSMSHMFQNCNRLNSFVNVIYPEEGVAPQLQNMSYAFYGCTLFNQLVNIPNSVTNTSNMFAQCRNLNSISDINTGIVDSSNMFRNCTNITAVNFLSSSLTNAAYMFYNCYNLVNLTNYGQSNIHVSNAMLNGESMFYNCKNLVFPTITFDNDFIKTPHTFGRMFANCTKLRPENIEYIGAESKYSGDHIAFKSYNGSRYSLGIMPFVGATNIKNCLIYDENANFPTDPVFDSSYTDTPILARDIVIVVPSSVYENRDWHNSIGSICSLSARYSGSEEQGWITDFTNWDEYPVWEQDPDTGEWIVPYPAIWFSYNAGIKVTVISELPSDLRWLTEV